MIDVFYKAHVTFPIFLNYDKPNDRNDGLPMEPFRTELVEYTKQTAVAGRNPQKHQLIWRNYDYLTVFYTCQVVFSPDF